MENGQTYKVSWKYIVNLNDVQESTEFRLSAKLKKQHIGWSKHKMNVSMASQTLSSSVADAIEFLCFGMQMEEFQDSYNTEKFIFKVDMAFDMLISRNPCDKGAKTPVTAQNLATWQNDAESLAKFIFELRDSLGRLLCNSPHKTPIWGFAISLHSMADICQHLLKHPVAPFGHILTYRFSQDHLEFLFNKVWHRCGWISIPDVLQFQYILCTILLHNSIEPSKTRNFTPFIEIFQSSLIDFRREPKEDSSSIIEETDVDIMEAEQMAILLNEETPNILLDNMLCYIAGFIIKHLMKILSCTNCHEEMLLKEDDHYR